MLQEKILFLILLIIHRSHENLKLFDTHECKLKNIVIDTGLELSQGGDICILPLLLLFSCWVTYRKRINCIVTLHLHGLFHRTSNFQINHYLRQDLSLSLYNSYTALSTSNFILEFQSVSVVQLINTIGRQHQYKENRHWLLGDYVWMKNENCSRVSNLGIDQVIFLGFSYK